MTTITYRDTGRVRSSRPSSSGVFAQFSALARKLAAWRRQRQTAREIESMPLDMRKDFGWPATDISERRKGMQ